MREEDLIEYFDEPAVHRFFELVYGWSRDDVRQWAANLMRYPGIAALSDTSIFDMSESYLDQITKGLIPRSGLDLIREKEWNRLRADLINATLPYFRGDYNTERYYRIMMVKIETALVRCGLELKSRRPDEVL